MEGITLNAFNHRVAYLQKQVRNPGVALYHNIFFLKCPLGKLVESQLPDPIAYSCESSYPGHVCGPEHLESMGGHFRVIALAGGVLAHWPFLQ